MGLEKEWELRAEEKFFKDADSEEEKSLLLKAASCGLFLTCEVSKAGGENMAKILTLKRNHQFMRAYKKGKFFVGRLMVIYTVKNNSLNNQIGISASKKVGNSVKRNRVKRLIRECYRGYQDCLPTGYDIVIVARTSDPLPTFKEIAKEMKFLFKKMGMFSVEKWESLKKV